MNDRAVSACLVLAGPDEGEEYTRSRTWLWLFVLFVAVAVATMLLGSSTPALASGSSRSVSSSDDDGDDDDDSGGGDSSGGSSGGDSVQAAQTHDSAGDSGSHSMQQQSDTETSNGHVAKSDTETSNGHVAKSDTETSVDKPHTQVSPTVTTPTRTRPSSVGPTKTKDVVLPKAPLTNPVLPRPNIRPRVEAGVLPATGGTPWWAVHVGSSLIALGLAGLFLARSIALASGRIPAPYRVKRYRGRSKRRTRGPP